jgi:hypothetical protein
VANEAALAGRVACDSRHARVVTTISCAAIVFCDAGVSCGAGVSRVPRVTPNVLVRVRTAIRKLVAGRASLGGRRGRVLALDRRGRRATKRERQGHTQAPHGVLGRRHRQCFVTLPSRCNEQRPSRHAITLNSHAQHPNTTRSDVAINRSRTIGTRLGTAPREQEPPRLAAHVEHAAMGSPADQASRR